MRLDAGARLKLRRWLPPLLWAGVILFVTSIPGRFVPREVSPYDKLVHLTIYGFFAVLLTRDLTQITSPWRAAMVAIVIAALFGGVDEWHQQFIRGRSTDVADWVADSAGAALGAALIATFYWFRRSRNPITQ
jgi:VanZ family protein